MSSQMDSQQRELLEQILSGKNRQLQVMAAQGVVPLPPERLIPIQIALAGSPDEQISGFAKQAMADLDPSVGVSFVRDAAGEVELRYLGLHAENEKIVEAVIRRPDVPRGVLIDLAPSLEPGLQEVLVHRQDAILDQPEILVALEQNSDLSSYAKRRIWEYREHLLPRDKVPPKDDDALRQEAEAVTDQEMDEAIAEAREKAGGGEDSGAPIEVDKRRQLSESEIRALPVPMRMKLARKANKQVRQLLIRDSSSMVAVAVITGNDLPDSEVEQIASNRSVCEEVIREIPRKQEWIRKYTIAKALVRNPKTPPAIAHRLVPRMSVRDLRDLSRDRNIPEAIRQMATRLYQAKR